MKIKELITLCNISEMYYKELYDSINKTLNVNIENETDIYNIELSEEECISIVNNLPDYEDINCEKITKYFNNNTNENNLLHSFTYAFRKDDDGFISIKDFEYYNMRCSSGIIFTKSYVFITILNSPNISYSVYKYLKDNKYISCSYNCYKLLLKPKLSNLLSECGLLRNYKILNINDYFIHPYFWTLVCMTVQPLLYIKITSNDFTDIKFYKYKVPDDIPTSKDIKINKEIAWKYFYPEGNGKSKKGYDLHHKNPRLKTLDILRYSRWNISDLILLDKKSHGFIHRKIDYDISYLSSENNTELINILYQRYLSTTESNSDINLFKSEEFEKISPLSKYSIEVSNSLANKSVSVNEGNL